MPMVTGGMPSRPPTSSARASAPVAAIRLTFDIRAAACKGVSFCFMLISLCDGFTHKSALDSVVAYVR